MEEELKCPVCRHFAVDPVLLQCSHSYCRECALRAQQRSPLSPPSSSSSGMSDTVSICVSDDQESDKLSVVSEADSGVYIFGQNIGAAAANGSNRGSRPSSFLSSLPSAAAPTTRPSLFNSPSTSGFVINCENCHKSSFYADEQSISRQPTNLALQRLIRQRRPDSRSRETTPEECKFCEESPRAVTLYCDACGFFFCDFCKPVIHPQRGPLKEHNIVAWNLARRSAVAEDSSIAEHFCDNHPDETLTMFCIPCHSTVCCKCIQGRHSTHNVQSLSTTAKSHKSELSKTLEELSEKAKAATVEVGHLKALSEKINNNCEDFKKTINSQIDLLIVAIEERRNRLLEFVNTERDTKRRNLRDQISKCSSHLSKTTGLIQFCIEILKEPDPVAYLPVGSGLQSRAIECDFLWQKNINTKADVDPGFVLTLDTAALEKGIECLEFAQLKAIRNVLASGDSSKAPPPPYFLTSECSAENNSVVLSWDCLQNGTAIDGFILELDSGRDDGRFKEVYRGPDSTCRIDGLHFNTLYNAQLKAFNSVGESDLSDPICLQTASVAWFQLSKNPSQSEIQLSNDDSTLSATSIDYNVVLGTVSFSRGIHYWEISVDSHEANTDIVVGVCQQSVERKQMLGKDIHGWAMYVDERRSWFLHNDTHHGRNDGGIGVGSVIGVLLDCDRGTLRFFINDRPLMASGVEFAFRNMPRGLYSPAFSVNKGATLTVHSGLSASDRS